jgi:ribosomal protein L7Ae-like RNA K-turn-binding protein
MLPKEYIPTDKYLEIYNQSLSSLSGEVAYTVRKLAEKLYNKKGKDIVLVSLARAGTPVGVLLKRYFKFKWNLEIPHYTISIIRDRGIDELAITTIAKLHNSQNIQFIDGWVGKGAINKQLQEACTSLKEKLNCCKDLDDTLAVLTDPANITDLYGTRTDFLIPSACLNATVTGLISRTIYKENGYHGAVFFEEMIPYDKTYEFINEVENYFGDTTEYFGTKHNTSIKGIDEVKEIQETYNIKDFNKIKPGIGETTRVLLRRIPQIVLIDPDRLPEKYYKHIIQLCKEKKVVYKFQALKLYGVVGIIKELSKADV